MSEHNWDAVKHTARHHWGTESSSSGVEPGRRLCSGVCCEKQTPHPVGCCTNTKALQDTRNVVLERPPGTLPQMSREIKMPSAQRQSSAVFRQMDLGGILGVESIFQAASAVPCGLVSKLPGKHLHISSVLVLLPITFWGFYYVMIYLANVTSPTATSNVIEVKPWASNISQITQVMSARWARTSTRGNN